MFRKVYAVVAVVSLTTIGMFLGSERSDAQFGPGQQGPLATRGIPTPDSSLWPWNAPSYRGYEDQAKTYQLYVNTLPVQRTDDPNAAFIVAHVPQNATVWLQDKAMPNNGSPRFYQSPPLSPGRNYVYTVRVAWTQDNKVVSESHDFTVRAGDIHCVFLMQAGATLETKETAANLAKLSPEDRKLAEEQKVCAVQPNIKLGAMGTPVKVTVKGQPVFLCCEACREHAVSRGDQIVAKVKELKAKGGADNGKKD
jgi:uncharacterized protein (TIGR03000 family)